MKQPRSEVKETKKRARQRQKSDGPKLLGEKRKSLSVVFNLNDPEHRALYKMVQSAGDVNAFLLRVLKQVHQRLHRARSRHKAPLSDQVLDQIKREVESKEEEDAMRPIFFQEERRK